MIEKLAIISNEPLANEKCESCIFKNLEWAQEPCLSCRFGKFGGKEKNYIEDEPS